SVVKRLEFLFCGGLVRMRAVGFSQFVCSRSSPNHCWLGVLFLLFFCCAGCNLEA
ncbi:hypothetical protein Ancab_035030, partial [Ancistrocladus abbreviatus]